MSEILGYYESDIPDADVIVLTGAAVANMMKPITCRKCDDYAVKVSLPFNQKQLDHATRVDVIWDQYFSSKAHTQKSRGKGIRRRLNPSTKVTQ